MTAHRTASIRNEPITNPDPSRRSSRAAYAVAILLALAFGSLVFAVAYSLIPAFAGLPLACAGLLGAAGVAVMVAERWVTAESMLGVALACMVAYGYGDGAPLTRGDHDIGAEGYSRLAARIARRPALDRLLITARADGVVTNDEIAQLNADEVELDRREALGLR